MGKLFSLLAGKTKQLRSQLETLRRKTPTCKLCYERKAEALFDVYTETTICEKCYEKFNVLFRVEKKDNFEILSLYEYDETFKTILYDLKALGDIVLAPLFLERHLPALRLKYHGYILIPAPSNEEDDKVRGFNHVVEIFKSLNLEMLPLIKKSEVFKQSDLHYNERQEVGKKLEIKEGERVRGKKILIVDDLKTSGATLRAIYGLLKPYNPKVIKALTIACTVIDK